MVSKISDLKVGMTVFTNIYGKGYVLETGLNQVKLKIHPKIRSQCPYFF